MGLVESYIKLLERKYDGMLVKYLGNHSTTMAPQFKIDWEMIGSKQCSVSFDEMELAMQIPDTLDGLIYPLFIEELDNWRKLIDRKEKINKIIDQQKTIGDE